LVLFSHYHFIQVKLFRHYFLILLVQINFDFNLKL
jgi:hypothetical protein